MAVTEQISGTQSATLDTEHTLATIPDDGVFQLCLNVTNMANADRTIVRVKVKVLSVGSSVLEDTYTIEHAQAADVFRTIPYPSVHEIVFTLEQTDGTGRSYEWSVLKVA